ncbi:hypothetical protein BN1708_012098 [Verticillium longisporum]|uniref:Uncharacterized protein n=1 Tax=Verticillium longisporum TaxID=100787 RepID=A0A0G4L6D8_VERLO|nr:hypothetical protein BN1708_012098 [Verticillium longisporum]
MAGADVDVPLTCSSRGEILGIQSQERSRCARRGIPQRQTQPDGCSSRGSVFSYSPQHSPFNWLNHRPTRRPQEIKIQQSKSSSTWSMMRAVVRSAPGYVKKVDRCKISAVGPGTPKPQAPGVCWDKFGSWDLQNMAVDQGTTLLSRGKKLPEPDEGPERVITMLFRTVDWTDNPMVRL